MKFITPLIMLMLAFLICGTAVFAQNITASGESTPGDVNGDGDINAKDITLLKRFVAGHGTELDRVAANVNGDDIVNAKDITLLKRFVSGHDVELLPPPTEDASVKYSLKVTDASQAPKSSLFVYVYEGDEQVAFGLTDGDGTASFELERGDYTFVLESTTGEVFTYNEEDCVFTAQKHSAEVVLYSVLSETMQLSCSFSTPAPIYAYYLASGGGYSIDISEERAYFILVAEQTGVYRISVESDGEVFVGTYGNPYYVLKNDITASADHMERESESSVLIDIATSNLASPPSRAATNYLIGIDGTASCKGILKVERIADHETTPEDLPYTPYGAELTPEFYNPPEATLPGYTLVNFNLADPELKIVYNENDGYYHHMTEDGPIVLVKLDIASPYIASFKEMCSKQKFACYVYDDNGEFVEKVTYHDMMLAYIKACATNKDGIGAYPLDDHLIKAIKSVGRARGWYNLDEHTNIFDEEAEFIVPENAWMFALCYAEVKVATHRVTVKSSSGEALEGVSVNATDASGALLASASTDSSGVATLYFAHPLNCSLMLDESLSAAYDIPAEGYVFEGTELTVTLTPKS